MDSLAEVPKLNTNTETKYFEQPAAQTFFAKWCEINDSIAPQFVDRTTWSKKDLLRPNDRGGKTLFLPKDLQLWEMVDVIEQVDKDTYASNPDFVISKREELKNLGEMFQNTGVYIAQRIDGIDQGRGIAENMAQDFYNYGYALLHGEKPKPITIEEIAQAGLNPNQVDEVDKWLAGDKLYASRRAKAEQLILKHPESRDEIIEGERQKTLAQFFSLAQKALDSKSTQGEPRAVKEKPWEQVTPVKKAFLDKIEGQIQKAIETPKQELIDVVLRRGLENLVKEMRANILPEDDRNRFKELFSLIGVDFIAQQKKLYDVLNIPALKVELEEARSTGDVRKIGEKEIEIASKMQDLIRHLPFQSISNNPAEMVAKGYINCVGASALGGGFLSELGINYLVGSVPDHSILVLATSDRRVIWMDMLNYVSNEPLTNEMIQKTIKGGKPLKIEDVWEFSHHPTAGGLTLDIDSEKFRLQLLHVKEWQSFYLTLFPSRTGHLVQFLINTASLLHLAGMEEEALESGRLAISVDPQIADFYKNFAITLSSLGRFDEAIDVSRKAIALDTRHYDSYLNLGKILVKSGRQEEAIGVCNKALEINPRAVDTYEALGSVFINLKRFNEALNLYHELILIDPKNVLANLELSIIYWEFGQDNEAVKYCRKCIEIADQTKDRGKTLAELAESIIVSITENRRLSSVKPLGTSGPEQEASTSRKDLPPSDLPESHFVQLSREEYEAQRRQQWETVRDLDDNDPKKIVYLRRFTEEYRSPVYFNPELTAASENPYRYYAVETSRMNELPKVEPYRPTFDIPQGARVGFVIGYHHLEKPWGHLFMQMLQRQASYDPNRLEFIIIQNKDKPTGEESSASDREIQQAVKARGMTHIIDVHEQLATLNHYMDGHNDNPQFREPHKSGAQGEYTLDPFIPTWMIEQYYQGYIYPQLQYAINEQIKKAETLIKSIQK